MTPLPENIDLKQIAEAMIHAMKNAVDDYIEDIRELASDELEDFAKRSLILGQKVLEGKINETQAAAILKIRQNAVETVLLSIAGISLVAAQQAINAALDVLKGVLFKAVPGVNLF